MDKTISTIGQSNSLLQKIRHAKGDENMFDVGCLCHLAHLCAGKRAKELSVNVEDFVIDIYHHFRRSAKGKQQLTKFMNFNNNEVRKVINRVSIKCLNLGK